MSGASRKHIFLFVLLAFCGLQESALAQYGGPSILSRGGNQPGRRGRAPVSFTGYLGGNYRYESGLLIPTRSVDGQNQVPSTSDFGYGVEGGVYGGHDWRTQSVGLDYRGDYRFQRRQSGFNGTNHALAFDYIFRPSRRIQVVLRETGGTTNRAFGSFAAPTLVDNTRQGIPLAELFDIRTYFAQSGATVSWMKSPRLQISVGGDVFFVKRRSASLINSQGVDGRANAMYRVDRRTYVGLEYQYYKFDFPRSYAGTEAQGPGLRVRRTFGRRWNLEGLGGVLLFNSFGTENVALSPEVAAILGRPSTTASFVRQSKSPNMELNLTYQQLRGAFRASFNNGVGSGNGVYLATKRTSAGGGYSYSGLRRTSVGASANWTRSQSASLRLSSYETYQAGITGSYKLAEQLNLTGQIDYRRLQGVAVAGRSGIVASFSLSYSTSKLPLSIW